MFGCDKELHTGLQTARTVELMLQRMLLTSVACCQQVSPANVCKLLVTVRCDLTSVELSLWHLYYTIVSICVPILVLVYSTVQELSSSRDFHGRRCLSPHDLENLCSNAHSHDEYLCQVSLKSLH